MKNKLTNKRLVKYLMDVRRIDMISINANNIVVQVSSKFTPAMGKQLIEEVGHMSTARLASKEGSNYIIFPRF